MERDDAAPTSITDPDGGLASPPGRTLAGSRYLLGAPLGRGGMGDVLSARDLQIGRDVAIKRLRVVTDGTLERFMREACIQGQLDHPAIVPVHELGVDEDGVPFFVMKRLAGATLAERIATSSRATLLRAFVDVCLAVEFAHQRGFVHRDLKPANIVLGDFGEVYVLDWGVAKVMARPLAADPRLAEPAGAETHAGVVIGTPGYMAPEQALGDPDVDARADVYALGCILFEILAGQRLHPGGQAGLASAIAGVDARASRRGPEREIAPELDAIVVDATATVRTHRIQTARELGERVQRYLDGDRDLARRRALAREQLADAVAAFGADVDGEARRRAMRSAGRALALDPELRGAAELVSRLMLDPPAVVPREVIAELAAERAEMTRRGARVALVAALAYLAFLPLLFTIGFSSPVYAALLLALVGANLAALGYVIRARGRASHVPSLVAAAALVGLLGRMFSPFLVAPGLAAIIGMAIMLVTTPPTRRAVIVAITVLIAAVVAPWLLEALGLLSPSFELTPSSMIVYSPGLDDEHPIGVGVLIAYTASVVVAAMSLAAGVRTSERGLRERLQLQAWQLRQLVPAG